MNILPRAAPALAPALAPAPALALAFILGSGPVSAEEPFALPPETASLLPGPGVETAQANCSGCHSADYILTQPRNLPDPKAFWATEVTKMRRFYAAPIDDAAVPEIVAYLAATYAR